MTVVIAVDGMGGDNAPHAVLEGLVLSGKSFPDVSFLLFGDEAILAPLVDRHNLQDAVTLVHTDERVLNETPAAQAIRSLRRSSMRLAIEAVKSGKAHGVVSSGNTGAYMALSKILLKTLDGIDRPAIVSTMPTPTGATVMLDLGANIEASPAHLIQFSQMGQAYSKHVLGVSSPSIGLLNIGSEDLKGHAILKETQELIRSKKLLPHFYGFIEGDDILAGTVDVVVTDGFTGNVSLKSMEGTIKFFSGLMKREFKRSFFAKIGILFAARALKRLKNQVDPRLYNGAPFLGLKGVAVKSHGGADEIAFAAALKVAIEMVQSKVNDQILADIQKAQESLDLEDTSLQSEKSAL